MEPVIKEIKLFWRSNNDFVKDKRFVKRFFPLANESTDFPSERVDLFINIKVAVIISNLVVLCLKPRKSHFEHTNTTIHTSWNILNI